LEQRKPNAWFIGRISGTGKFALSARSAYLGSGRSIVDWPPG
jgi:hypothetical protein